jgi:hypothetical protein
MNMVSSRLRTLIVKKEVAAKKEELEHRILAEAVAGVAKAGDKLDRRNAAEKVAKKRRAKPFSSSHS